MTGPALDTLGMDVLEEVCQTRETRSAVALTATLVDRGRVTETGDPYGLIAATLAELCDAGYVTYREGHYGVPVAIRATTEGFAVAGYAVRFRRAARGAYMDAATRPGDPTDFTTLRYRTDGGPSERMPLPEHVDVYPGHPHQSQLEEIRVMHPDTPSRKGGHRDRRYTDEDARAFQSLVASGMTQKAASVQMGIPYGSVFGLMNRKVGPVAPVVAAAPAEESLRTAILAVVDAEQVVDDSRDLPKLLKVRGGRSDGLHAVQHVVGSLIRSGDLRAVVKTSGSGQQRWYTGIRRVRPVTMDEATVAEVVAPPPPPPDEPVEAVVDGPVVTMTEPNPWPMLVELRARVAASSAERAKAERLMAAAELLDGLEPAIVEALIKTAEAAAASYALSRVEAEYLAFAEAHTKETTDAR